MKKTLIALLAALLLAAFACSALAVNGDVTMVDAKAYSDAAMTEYVDIIPAGTALLVRSYESYADVYVDGQVLYVKPSALLNRDFTSDYAATLTKGTKVYQQADSDSNSYTLKSSGTVNICAVNGDWALVQTTGPKGLYAFVPVSKLTDIRTR